jgi:hypothetical protein
MFSWNSKALVENVLKARPRAGQQRDAYDRRAQGLRNFLSRVYYELRNLGLAPQDRALNFSATNAFQAAQVMGAAGDLELDRITVRKSPVCRPESECYDVELGFFNPSSTNIANRVFRFTVDVSGVMPVSIGQIRDWSKRA